MSSLGHLFSTDKAHSSIWKQPKIATLVVSIFVVHFQNTLVDLMKFFHSTVIQRDDSTHRLYNPVYLGVLQRLAGVVSYSLQHRVRPQTHRCRERVCSQFQYREEADAYLASFTAAPTTLTSTWTDLRRWPEGWTFEAKGASQGVSGLNSGVALEGKVWLVGAQE